MPCTAGEALLAPGGRLLEARGPACSSGARSALHDTASSDGPRAAAQGQGRAHDVVAPPGAQSLDAGRCLRPGRRAVHRARENQAPAPGLEGLTEREQQVVVSANLGKSGKEIAYDLGISHATVRVLLARANSRLGATSTEQLLQLPVVRALRGETPGALD
jgi:DNA-binding NarL/FixJ family response regulator